MLRRNWGIFLVIGLAVVGSPLLWFALQPGKPNLPVYEYAERGSPNYQAGGSRCQPSVLATTMDRREAASQGERCAKEAEDHRLQSNDLVQQARAADAAQAQALLAYKMTLMGVFGTIAGFLTLLAAGSAAYYARGAAREAKRNADFTEGANEISRETAQAQLRPWITCADFSIHPFTDSIVNEVLIKRGLMGALHIKNTGANPAVDVRMYNTHEVGEPESPPHFTRSSDNIESGKAGSLGPGITRSTSPNAVAESETDRIMTHKAWLYLYCFVTYRDPTSPDKLLTTEACHAIHYGGEMAGPDGKRIPRFACLAIGEQNRLT